MTPWGVFTIQDLIDALAAIPIEKRQAIIRCGYDGNMAFTEIEGVIGECESGYGEPHDRFFDLKSNS